MADILADNADNFSLLLSAGLNLADADKSAAHNGQLIMST